MIKIIQITDSLDRNGNLKAAILPLWIIRAKPVRLLAFANNYYKILIKHGFDLSSPGLDGKVSFYARSDNFTFWDKESKELWETMKKELLS